MKTKNPDKIINKEDSNDIAIKVGTYKGNTIYDRGEKTKYQFRFNMRGPVNEGFTQGPIVANGHNLKDLKKDFNSDKQYLKEI